MRKSEKTKELILRKGMEISSVFGLHELTIGKLAKALEMSRTGVISHFSNKEDMQIEILQHMEDEFVAQVIESSYTENGVENLCALKDNWLAWEQRILNIDQQSSCPFVKAAVEYQDRPDSVVRQFMSKQQEKLLQFIEETCQRAMDQGLFSAKISPPLFAFEFYSLYLGYNVQKSLGDESLMRQRLSDSVENLIARSRI